MKYSSRPKPVRIRLESGGKEHFSLDSLLLCFNPLDLLNKKNELLRWLSSQQGDNVLYIYKEVEQIDFVKDNVFLLYKSFFSEYFVEKNISNFKDLLLSWIDKEKYKRNVCFLKNVCYKDAETLVDLYNDEKGKWLETDWKSIIEKYVLNNYIESENDGVLDVPQCKEYIDQPLLLYFLGTEYFNNGDYSKSKLYLQFALNHGVVNAKDSLKNLALVGEIVNMEPLPLPETFNQELVISIINYCIAHFDKFEEGCKAKDMLGKFNKTKKIDVELIEEEFSFVDFAFSCCCLCDYSDISEKYEEATDLLTIFRNDLLVNEKNFIRNLIGVNCFEGDSNEIREKSRSNLSEMNYTPAQYIIGKLKKENKLDGLRFREKSINDQIRVILKNIFYFRGPVSENDTLIQTSVDTGLEKVDKKLIQNIIQLCVSHYSRLRWASSVALVKSYWEDYYMDEKRRALTSEEVEFVDFAFNCCRLCKYSYVPDKYTKAEDYLLVQKKNDVLVNEKLFVVNLIGLRLADNMRSVKTRCKNELKKMDYLPAQYINNTIADELLENSNFCEMDIDSQISFFLRNIFYFRK